MPTIGFILSKYLEGYYPYYNRKENCFYWKRDPSRVILELGPEVQRRRKHILSKGQPKCRFAENKNFELVIERLAEDAVKEDSWVRGEVLEIYRLLKNHGFITTIEAIQDGELVGALLGINLPNVFIAETMYQELRNRKGEYLKNISKGCLCYAVEKYGQLGYEFIDVQIPHPPQAGQVAHPSFRLGESLLSLEQYQEKLRHAVICRKVLDLSLYDPLFAFCEKKYETSLERPSEWTEWYELLRALLERDSRCREAWHAARADYNPDFVQGVDNITDSRMYRHFPESKEQWRDAPVLVKNDNGIASLEIFGFQVMQSWEEPLMKEMALAVTNPGSAILEVGFGLGICARHIQSMHPRKHIIIEANREIVTGARKQYHDQIKDGSVLVIDDFWENVIEHNLLQAMAGTDQYDGIVFDTFPLSKEELRRNHLPFFKHAARLLAPGGRFTYFSDEHDYMSVVHQKALYGAFPGATMAWRAINVHPPKCCEYWSSESILLVVVESLCETARH